MQNPTLIKEDTAVGFCRAISMSDSADYVYGWFLTGKRFRVQDGNNLAHIGNANVDTAVTLPADYMKSRHHANKVAVIENPGVGKTKVFIADVTNPSAPVVQPGYEKAKLNDLIFHPVTGVLLVCSEDSLIALDQNTMAILGVKTPQAGASQQFRAFTLSNDTVYAYYTGLGQGIAKYHYDPSAHSFTYLSAALYPLKAASRYYMANDNSLLYISTAIDSLRAVSKTAPHNRIAMYNHGADFIFDNLWGTMDMYYDKGYLFLNEYMGQTTIFGPPTVTTGIESVNGKQVPGFVYPNPAHAIITIKTGSKSESVVKIYDVSGKLIYIADVFGEKTAIDVSDLNPGFYFAHITAEGKTSTSKFIVE